MAWSKIDHTFHHHPKVTQLTDRAFRLHVSAILECGMFLTDGVIPVEIVKKGNKRVISELISAKLWEKVGEEYLIHNYLKYQTSKEKIEADREANRRRVAAFTLRNSPNKSSTNGITNALKEGTPNALVMSQEVRRKKKEIKDTDQTEFDLFWSLYPRSENKKTAERAFLKALKVASFDEIVNGVKRLVAAKGDPKFVPYAASWLNAERWSDQMTPKCELSDAPTPTPPRLKASDLPRGGVPMPDAVKDLREFLMSGVKDVEVSA